MPTDVSILVTGFEPFGGDDRNPSKVIAERLRGAVLPVAYAAAELRLNQCIDTIRPRAVLLCGLKASATQLILERQAFNEDDASPADNDGELRQGSLIDPTGPTALRTPLPLESFSAALNDAGVAWEYSDSAGRFICNHVYYTTLRRGVPCVFLHLPWPSDWGLNRPGQLTLAEIETGVRSCAVALARLIRSSDSA